MASSLWKNMCYKCNKFRINDFLLYLVSTLHEGYAMAEHRWRRPAKMLESWKVSSLAETNIYKRWNVCMSAWSFANDNKNRGNSFRNILQVKELYLWPRVVLVANEWEKIFKSNFVFKMDMFLMLRLVRCGQKSTFEFFFSVEKGSLEIEERT